MEILKTTLKLPADPPAKDLESLAYDQNQNAEYISMMETGAATAGLPELEDVLKKAHAAMVSATDLLEAGTAQKASLDEEAALGFLVAAAILMDKAEEEEKLPALDGAEMSTDGMRFQLRPPPPPKPSSAPKEKEDSEKEKTDEEKVKALAEEVQRQLDAQEKLNKEGGEPSESAEGQKALAEAALSAAEMAREMADSSNRNGDPKATAEELERAAKLQSDAANAIANGDFKASAELGKKSSEALNEALKELSNQMKAGGTGGEANTTTYKKLVNDYLRSISYE